MRDDIPDSISAYMKVAKSNQFDSYRRWELSLVQIYMEVDIALVVF